MRKVTTLRIHSGLDEWTDRNAKPNELGVFDFDPRPAPRKRANPWLVACVFAWLVVTGIGIYLGVNP